MYRNARINPVLRFIYFLLRCIAWLGVSVFYRRRIVLGREHLQFDGPAIIVVNHPSTLMDVLNVCLHIRQESYFLANYGLFKHPVSNWLLSRLFCIPVKRREDVAEGEVRNNDAVFNQSFQHLEKNGLLFIAAEGVSWMERWVRPFKTGAARIAFGVEKRNNWQLGVKIVPVGLSYSAPNLFRSEVIVHFGAPISVASWAAAEQEDHEKAVNDCTQAIEQTVRVQVLDTRDEAGQVFMEQLEQMYRPDFPKQADAYFEFRKNLIEKNIDNQELRVLTAHYFSKLQAVNVSAQSLALWTKLSTSTSILIDYILLVLGLPFFLSGYIFWFLPCYLPWLLAKKLNLYIGYDSNIKVLAGLITFPLALWGAFRIATHFTNNGWLGLGTMVALILLGYFTAYYLDVLQRRRAWQALGALRRHEPEAFEEFQKWRGEIIANASML